MMLVFGFAIKYIAKPIQNGIITVMAVQSLLLRFFLFASLLVHIPIIIRESTKDKALNPNKIKKSI